MNRRDFVRQMGIGLVAGWAFGQLSWPRQTWGGVSPKLCLALLADAHLKSGDDRRPEAQALARAVAEIKALAPVPDLVLFAGDLAHRGRADALDLGREILSNLPAPLWAVRGEGDCGRGGEASWSRRFGAPRFSRSYGGVHFLGLDIGLYPSPQGPTFGMGVAQLTWLAQELARLDPATPLVIISHAPLARLFLPWQQWTDDAAGIGALLSHFSQVLYLHGHMHGAGVSNNANKFYKLGDLYCSANREPKTETPLHLCIPATSWPLPAAVQGTPAIVRPGLGPCGCGWALVILDPGTQRFLPYLWQV